MRSMKWHIYNSENNPLCWDDKAIEFDTKESAERFLHSYVDFQYDSYEEYCQTFGVVIKEGILFYDYGYINCTNKIVKYNEEIEDEELIDIN